MVNKFTTYSSIEPTAVITEWVSPLLCDHSRENTYFDWNTFKYLNLSTDIFSVSTIVQGISPINDKAA